MDYLHILHMYVCVNQEQQVQSTGPEKLIQLKNMHYYSAPQLLCCYTVHIKHRFFLLSSD